MGARKRKFGVCIAVALIISVTTGLLWNGKHEVSYAREVFLDTENLVQQKINAGVPFRILEIVSDEANARMGYLVGGCEPDLYGRLSELEAEGLLTNDTNAATNFPIAKMVRGDMIVSETQLTGDDLPGDGFNESKTTLGAIDALLDTQGYTEAEKEVFYKNIFGDAYSLSLWKVDVSSNDAGTGTAENEADASDETNTEEQLPDTEQPSGAEETPTPEAPEQTVDPGDTQTPDASGAPDGTGQTVTPEEAGTPGGTEQPAATENATMPEDASIQGTGAEGMSTGSGTVPEAMAERNQDGVTGYVQENTNVPAASTPATDAPTSDIPAASAPTTDAPVTGTPNAPATDTPATGTPETNAPATDTPATGTPETNAPTTDTPATDTPETDVPTTDIPVTNTPDGMPAVSGGDMPAAPADADVDTLAEFTFDKDMEVWLYIRDKYQNNEWFKRYILGMTASYTSLNVEVTTKTVDAISQADIDGADLIYISGLNAAAYKTMSADTAKALLARITGYDTKTPCIIDYEVYGQLANAADANSNNLYKLCMVLAAENPESVYADISERWDDPADSESWQTVRNAIVINNGGHFVRENIYWYTYKDGDYTAAKNGTASNFVNGNLFVHFAPRAIEAGFLPVVEAIDAENYNNSINNPNRESMNTGDITSALAVQYILKYEAKGLVIYKDEIKVLELQPCKDFKFGTDAGKKELIDKWLPMFQSNHNAVQVTCMTTAEFIGHNENINEEYDLIYIGSNIGKYHSNTMSVTVDGVTENRTYRRFNDPNMDGIVYSHVGDYGNVQYWGLIATDYAYNDKTMYRYPGNDLTTYKLAELKEFLNSGSPIIVADDFFTYNGGRSITPNGMPTGINGGRQVFTGADGKAVYGILDTSTYMYQLVVYAMHGRNSLNGEADLSVDWINRSSRNFFYESGADAQSLLNYINQQKLYLNLTTRPAEYTYTTTGSYGYIDSVTYLQPEQDGNYYLNYEFSISSLGVASAAQTYDCRLYIDINNDGKFSKTTEEITSLVLTEITTGNVVERAADGYHLYAGVPYRLRRALPSEYMGCIAWNLVVTASDNKDIHASETGYTVVKEKDGQKQELKILQVTTGYSTDFLGEGINGNNVNLQQELANGTTVWGELLANVPDFTLNITTIPTYGDNGLVARFKEDNTYLSQFDMLIFGFGDGFADIRYKALLDAITEYANSGHCILLAHDTTFVETSQLPGYYDYTRPNYNVDGSGPKRIEMDTEGRTNVNEVLLSEGWTGSERDPRPRYLTQYVRNIGGMDPYGVTVNGSPARSGQEIQVGTDAWNTLVASGKDMAFKPNTYQTVTVPNTQGATYIQLRENQRPGDNVTWNGTLPMNNVLCNRLFGYKMQAPYWAGMSTTDWGGDYSGGYPGADARNCNTLVGKVNDGMITNYPYKIPDNFFAANTHGQYWALDLESDDDKDGESDIVVWYTINEIATNVDGWEDFYNMSPYDASNCYYIYNKGNITYTGVGHTAVNGEQEVKLFINTMIASYVASIKNPSVSFVEDGSSSAFEINSISVPVTDDGRVLTSSANKDVIRVYFKVYDNNIVKGTKTITGNFYLGNGKGGDERREIKLSIYDVAGNKLYDASSPDPANVLVSGESYYVEVPVSQLNGRYSVDLEVEVFTDWVRNGTRVQSDKISDFVTIGKVELFDLD